MKSETIIRLEAFTDNVEFERMCSDILARLSYPGIEPQGVGQKDGGKDALLLIDKTMKIVFHYSMRKDWKTKIREDIETVKINNIPCDKFVFVSNRFITPKEKDDLKKEIIDNYSWSADIYDNERIRVELDTNSKDLREKYLRIPQDEKVYEKINDIHERLFNINKSINFQSINDVVGHIISLKNKQSTSLEEQKIPLEIKDKMQINDFSNTFEDIFKRCMSKFNDIENFLKSGSLNSEKITTLLISIKMVYMKKKFPKRPGDIIFNDMIVELLPQKTTDEQYQAYITLVCYFFHTCEVFETVNPQ